MGLRKVCAAVRPTVAIPMQTHQQQRGHVLHEADLLVAHLGDGHHALLALGGLVAHGRVDVRVRAVLLALEIEHGGGGAGAGARGRRVHGALLERVEALRERHVWGAAGARETERPNGTLAFNVSQSTAQSKSPSMRAHSTDLPDARSTQLTNEALSVTALMKNTPGQPY